jgi:hypothetical protein
MDNHPTTATPWEHDLRCDTMRRTRRSCFIWVAYTRKRGVGSRGKRRGWAGLGTEWGAREKNHRFPSNARTRAHSREIQ